MMKTELDNKIPTYINYFGTSIETLSTEEIMDILYMSLDCDLPKEFLSLLKKILISRGHGLNLQDMSVHDG